MVRTYTRKAPKYSSDDLQKAIFESVTGKNTIRFCCKKYNIPYATLRSYVAESRLTQRSSPLDVSVPVQRVSGRNPALKLADEQYLVSAIIYAGELGWPFSKNMVLDVVQSFSNFRGIDTQFKDNRPGEFWYYKFLKRHKLDISLRRPEVVTKARAKGLTSDIVTQFFDLAEKKAEEGGYTDKRLRVWNTDETGLSTNATGSKLIYKRGTKDVQLIQANEGKAQYTVLFACSAAGEFLPPYVVYKSKHLHSTWVENGPPGTMYNCSDSGWMEMDTFAEWFEKLFVPHVKHYEKPLVLYFDGHASHMSARTIYLAIAEQIYLICLPAHTSGALQPLDVGVFKGAKAEWKNILGTFYRSNDNEPVTKETFPALLSDLFKYMLNHAGSAVNGFIKSGLFPLDRTKIPKEKLVLATTVVPLPVPLPNPASEPVTPLSAMRRAVTTTLAPKSLMETKKKLRRRVQREGGECLTEESVLQRMIDADTQRKNRMNKGKVTKKLRVVKNEPAPENDVDVVTLDPTTPSMPKKRRASRPSARKTDVIVVGRESDNANGDFISKGTYVSPVRKLRSSSRLTVNGWEK
eukprot:sb/3463394/